MSIVKTTRLTKTEGTTDKEYRVHLVKESKNYFVNVEYGRRNGKLRADTKTEQAVDKDMAEKIFEQTVAARLKDNYTTETKEVCITVTSPKKVAAKAIVKQEIICAVSISTESSDYYVFCLKGKNVNDIVDQVKEKLGSETEYMANVSVDILTGHKNARREIISEISSLSQFL